MCGGIGHGKSFLVKSKQGLYRKSLSMMVKSIVNVSHETLE